MTIQVYPLPLSSPFKLLNNYVTSSAVANAVTSTTALYMSPSSNNNNNNLSSSLNNDYDLYFDTVFDSHTGNNDTYCVLF